MTKAPTNCDGCNKIGTELCPYDVWNYNQDGCDYIRPYKRTQEFKDFADMCGLSCHSEMLPPSCQTCVNEMAHFCKDCPRIKKDEVTPISTHSVSSDGITTPIVITLLQMHCRNVINTDKSGLAFGLARCKQIAEGYNWIPRREWGNYDCNHRTVATLQKEVGYMIEELVETCERALRESGERVNVNIREVETVIAALEEKKS